MKKKIIYIGQSYPYPADSGGRIKTLATLRLLARMYDVTAVFVSEEKPNRASLQFFKKMGIRAKVYYLPTILQPVYKDLPKLFMNYLRGIPHSAYKYFLPEIADYVDACIARVDPDVVHVCHIGMSLYIKRKESRRVYFLELENIETHLQWSRFLYTRSWIRRVYVGIEGVVSFLFEYRKLRIYDHIFAICNEDKALVNSLFRRTHVTVQPITLSLPVMPNRHADRNILFVGTIGWPPNEDALEWFLEKIFPLITGAMPGTTLHVVGRPYAPLEKRMRHTNGVVYHGQQSALSDYMHNAGVFILPFRIEGGIKVKALTAFAHSVPVVSTPEGVRGYQVRHGKECLIARSPEQFARFAEKIMKDKTLAATLARNARVYATTHHGRFAEHEFISGYKRKVDYYARKHT